MQTPALFKAMNLGDGFGDNYDFTVSPDFSLIDPTEGQYTRSTIVDDFGVDPGFSVPFNPKDYVDIFDYPDLGIDPGWGQRIIDSDPVLGPFDGQVIDISGNVVTQTNEPLIPVAAVQRIALNNPGKEAEAIARTLQVTAPDWVKQFKTTDDLIRAASGLYNTAKAVITGKPIPPAIKNPNIQTINRPTSQSSLNSTNMLLIGGVALAAILLLRKK